MTTLDTRLERLSEEYGQNVIALSDDDLAIVTAALRGYAEDCRKFAAADPSLEPTWSRSAIRAANLRDRLGAI